MIACSNISDTLIDHFDTLILKIESLAESATVIVYFIGLAVIIIGNKSLAVY